MALSSTDSSNSNNRASTDSALITSASNSTVPTSLSSSVSKEDEKRTNAESPDSTLEQNQQKNKKKTKKLRSPAPVVDSPSQDAEEALPKETLHQADEEYTWLATPLPFSSYAGLPPSVKMARSLGPEIELKYYRDTLPESIHIPIHRGALADRFKVSYDVPVEIAFIRSFGGPAGGFSPTCIAHLREPSDTTERFLLVKVCKKTPCTSTERTRRDVALRIELKVFRRLAAHKDNEMGCFLMQIDGCLEDEGYHYLASPLMQGNMTDVFRGLIKIEYQTVACQWLTQLASALHALHQAGIIHRDVKPANCLIDWEGNIQLSNFESAYVSVNDEALVSGTDYAYRFRGTRNYIAPEVWNMLSFLPYRPLATIHDIDEELREFARYGIEADWWSLGCIAAELLKLGMYELLFCASGSIMHFVRMNEKERGEHLVDFGIYDATQRDLVQGLLNPNPKQRFTYEDLNKHAFFTCSFTKKSMFDNLSRALVRDSEAASFEFRADLSSPPKSYIQVSATRSSGEPDATSYANHTWINPAGRWA